MRLKSIIISISFTAITVNTQNQTRDGCPKDEYACLDVINSSQCLEQLVIEKLAPATKEALSKCVEYKGTVTKIPGAAKVRSKDCTCELKDTDVCWEQLCRCPGCHTAPINAAIVELFPPPCG